MGVQVNLTPIFVLFAEREGLNSLFCVILHYWVNVLYNNTISIFLLLGILQYFVLFYVKMGDFLGDIMIFFYLCIG